MISLFSNTQNLSGTLLVHSHILRHSFNKPASYFLPSRYEECKEKLVPFLKKVGFNPKKDIYFMPCSGLTGSNLKEPVPECTWYT